MSIVNKTKQSICVIVTVGIIFAILFELSSNALYYVKSNHFFYGGKNLKNTDIPKPLQVAEAVFHPYLAFINRVGRSGESFSTNNHGWQFDINYMHSTPACCDYPLSVSEDDIFVGIFGGSVASGFALTAQKTGHFRKLLNKLPDYQNKNIHILNFSMAGFKQPQQLLTLSYYISIGQKFDLILNIDGFNEVVTFDRNWREGVEPTYPADTVWGAMGRQVEQTSLPMNSIEHLVVAYHQRQAREYEKNIEECVIASCYGFNTLTQYYHLFRSKVDSKKLSNKVNKVSLFPTQFEHPNGEITNISEYTANSWLRSSMAMAGIAQSVNAQYIHILQPNQWYKKSGDYQPIDSNHIYDWIIEPVNSGYDALLEKTAILKMNGVNFFDATMIFKSIDEQMYIDDCCHYTDKGNEVLADKIANRISKKLLN